MRGLARWAVIAAAVVAASCGDDGSGTSPGSFEDACARVDGCETPANAVGGPREAIWRVLVARAPDGGYRIEAVDEVDVAVATGRPQGPLSGEAALAALDASGAPLELQLLRFPTTLVAEPVDPLADVYERDFTDEERQTVGYLPVSDDAERLAVVEPDGTVLASVDAPAPGEATGARREALVAIAPASACAHVVLIENTDDAHWFPRHFTSSGYVLRAPGPLQRATLAAALGAMEPMHCAGVNRVAFTDFPDRPGTAGMVVASFGGLVLLNTATERGGELAFTEDALQEADARAYLMHTIFHEAGHTLEFLLDYVASGGERYDGIWSPTRRTLAALTVDRVRLRGGFHRRWRELHASFRTLGWAGDHVGNDEAARAVVRPLAPEGLAAYGMLSHYATKGVNDDIADTVAWPLSAPRMRAAGTPDGLPPDVNDYGCVAMRAHAARSVPAGLAAVYAKLAFLRDLGALSEAAFDACTGAGTTLPVPVEGITVYEEGEEQRRFTEALSAGLRAGDDGWVFELTVSGTATFGDEEYAATLRLELQVAPASDIAERVPWPRGVYSLAPFEPNHFELRMPDQRAGNFDVYDGFVLVAEASDDRIVGSVVAREALRPDAPVPVPQVFDPPLQFRFRVDPRDAL